MTTATTTAIDIPTEEFRDAAGAVASVLSGSAPPFTEISTPDALTFRAVGHEHSLTVRTVFGLEFPTTLVDAKTLAAVARLAPGMTTSLEVTDEGLIVRSGRFRVRLSLAEEDMALPASVEPPKDAVEVDIRPLALALRFTSPDEARPMLGSVLLTPEFIAATDSYKVIEIPMTTGLAEPILLPRGAVKLAISLGMELARLGTDGTRVMISDDEATIVSRSVEGQFPNMRQLWPDTSAAATITADGPSLEKALGRFAALRTGKNAQVDLVAQGGSLVMESGDATDEIDCEGEWPERVRFDVGFLATCAGAFAGPMTLHMNSPLRPVACTGEESHRCLVVPQRIQ